MIYLTAEQVLFIHARLITETSGSHGVRDLSMLLSAIGRPQASFDNQDLYPDIFNKAAALLDSLIRNHPFVDGNKRTGIVAAGLCLQINGYRLTAPDTKLETFTLEVARAQKNIDEIAAWFRDHTLQWDGRGPDERKSRQFSEQIDTHMNQSILHVALVVRDYDEAIQFYCEKLHFTLVEDIYQPEQDKRWVVVAPPGSSGATLLLARAATPEQAAFIGRQTGGRVFLFLRTDDFWRDYTEMLSNGIRFVREPKEASYGTVAVFEDLYGNLWDLIQVRAG
jgi:death-on-curing family protein